MNVGKGGFAGMTCAYFLADFIMIVQGKIRFVQVTDVSTMYVRKIT